MEAFVYIWNNITDNKKYIGYHKGSKDDGYICSSGSEHFWTDFNDKSKEWKREIIFEGTRDEAYVFEQNLLKEVDLNSTEWYNLARGAEVIFTDEVREKIRKHHIGKTSGMKGKKHNEATKEKISAALMNRVFTEEHKEKLRKPNKDVSNKRGPKSKEFCEKMAIIANNRELIGCSYCDKLGQAHVMARWHGDKCKYNPNNLIKKHHIKEVICPHCNKLGNFIAMSRWHFNNCKKK